MNNMKKTTKKQKKRTEACNKLIDLANLLKKPNADTLELQDEFLEAVETAVEVLEEQGY